MSEIKYRPHLDRIAKTKSGLVRGAAGNCPIYTVYRGIPYAKPPVGDLRWKAPQPVEPWEGVRDCVEWAPIARQEVHAYDDFWAQELWYHVETQSEDCLYLNIWTPAITGEEKLPVLFWTHGGALVSGYGYEPEFDGEIFCRNGVILVTYDYRLGVLGFYANSELEAESPNGVAGNYGHLDQIAALKWVRENIAAFGGDPDNITVFGQSAGAASTQLLCTTSLTKGDIAGAIIVSSASASKPGGDGFMRAKTLDQAVEQGDRMMADLGCKTTDELRKLSFDEIMDQIGYMGPNAKYTFGTTIDGYVLTEPAAVAAYEGRMHDIRYMVGNTAGEGGLFGGPAKTLEDWKKRTAMMQGEDFLAKFPVNSLEEAAAIDKQNHGMMINNRAFCEAMLRNGKKPVYLYLFDRDLPGDDAGSYHTGELFYAFGTLMRNWRPFTGVDFDISLLMAKTWANFAKNGNPNGEGVPAWKPYTAESRCNFRYCEESACEPISETPVQKYLLEKKLG